MNRIQKISWWLLSWFSAAFIISSISISFSHFIKGQSWSTSTDGLNFTGWLAAIGSLGPLIFRKNPDKATCDERERLIYFKATIAGLIAACLITGLACMLPFFIMGPDTLIAVGWLPYIFMALIFTFFFIQFATLLFLHRKGAIQ